MKLLKEPMLHFAIAGGLLFAADAFLNRDRAVPQEAAPLRVARKYEGPRPYLQRGLVLPDATEGSGDEVGLGAGGE